MAEPLRAYQTPEHEPFLWSNGPNAALLIHGFPGTPAEMRPVADLLHKAGWTVQGLLLPGFGADFESLPTRRHTDWLAAVTAALTTLRQAHSRVMLIGNSMGAALGLQVAAHQPVDGLVLFSPFWRVDSWLDRAYPVAERFMPQVRPFRRANFADPRFRANLQNFMPDADLDDPAVQAAIRELRLPVHVLGQVRRAGQLGYRFAAAVPAPVLIIQGADDPLVKPHLTSQLAARLPNLAELVIVPGEHELVRGQTAGWDAVASAVCTFTDRVATQPRPPSPPPAGEEADHAAQP